MMNVMQSGAQTIARSATLPKEMRCEPAARRLRIALAFSRVPFPMMRGDQLTVAHLISFYRARGHVVDLYTLDVQGRMRPEQDAWLRESCRRVNIYPHGMTTRIAGGLRGLLRRQPVQVGMFHNPHLRADLLAATQRGEYDIIHCYYMRTAPDIPVDLTLGRDGRVPPGARAASFLALQLSQSLNTRRLRDNETSWARRMFYKLEADLCASFEARAWQGFTRSVLIGPADVAALEDLCRTQHQPNIDNWVYGAHGTDTDRFQPAVPDEIVPGRVVFSGSMLYQPNIQAVLWFVEHCWSAVRKACPSAELVVQGRDPAPAVQALHGKDGITVTGTVPEVGAIIRSSAVCINPVLAAAGMQNKLIEYMASNKAIVATSVANEGILAPSDTLLIADDAGAFAQAVIELLADPDRAIALGNRARSYVVEHWSWEAHFLKLEAEFLKALDHPSVLAADAGDS